MSSCLFRSDLLANQTSSIIEMLPDFRAAHRLHDVQDLEIQGLTNLLLTFMVFKLEQACTDFWKPPRTSGAAPPALKGFWWSHSACRLWSKNFQHFNPLSNRDSSKKLQLVRWVDLHVLPDVLPWA